MVAVILTLLASSLTGATFGLWFLGIWWRFAVGLLCAAWIWLAVFSEILTH